MCRFSSQPLSLLPVIARATPTFCHCEAPQGAVAISLFAFPYSRPYCLWAPEIATSGQKPSLLAMTGWGTCGLQVPEIATSEQNALLLAMTVGGHGLLAITQGNKYVILPLLYKKQQTTLKNN